MYQTKYQLSDKRNRLEQALGQVMGRSGQMISWFTKVYFPSPEQDKAEISKSWNKYYQDCLQSVEGNLFREITKAYREKNIPRFTELVVQSRQMLKKGIVRIQKPSGYDPELWANNTDCISYRYLTSEIDRMSGSSDFDKAISDSQVENEVSTKW